MTFPTIAFTVDFNGDPLTPSGSPADLSSRVEAFSYTYGKQSALDEFQPGTLSVTLKNDDRILDPLYAAGTYFGKLKPRKRVKLTATYGGTTYDQFTGFVDGWPQQYAPPAMAYVQLQATDLFVLLRNIDLPASVWTLEAASDATTVWYRLDETSGSSIGDSSGSKLTATLNFPRVEDPTQTALPAASKGDPLIAFSSDPSTRLSADAADAANHGIPIELDSGVPTALPITLEAWILPEKTNNVGTNAVVFLQSGTLVCYLEVYYLPASNTWYVRAFWDNGTNSRTSNYPSTPRVLGDVPHHLVGVLQAGSVTLYLDGVAIEPDATLYAPAWGPNAKNALSVGSWITAEQSYYHGRISDVRVYNSALSAARITAHHDAGATPWTGDTTGARLQRIATYIGLAAADVNFATGATLLGPTGLGVDALTYMQSIALTEGVAALLVEHRSTTGAGGKLTFYDKYAPYTATRSTTSQATFTDDPAAGAGAYRFESDNLTLTDDESQIVNEAVVQWTEGEVRVQDATSITAHGRKSRTFQTRLATAAEAQSLAEFLVALYKDAHVRITSLTLNPAGDSNLWAPALSLRYGDRVTFRFQPQGVGTAINTDYWIQGVSVSASQGVDGWTTTYYVTPATDVQLAVWDTSIWDNAAALWGP